MALSDLQKAQNKAAARVRNRAHSARTKKHHAALAAAEKAPSVSEAFAAYQAADQAFQEGHRQRESAIDQLRRKIGELQEQIRILEQSPEISELASARRTAANEWQRQKAAAIKDAEAQYPDLQGPARFSAAAWAPPADVLEEMERARAAATAEAQ